jgi:hypothetical protein
MDPERTDRVAGSLAWRYRREPLLLILSMFLLLIHSLWSLAWTQPWMLLSQWFGILIHKLRLWDLLNFEEVAPPTLEWYFVDKRGEDWSEIIVWRKSSLSQGEPHGNYKQILMHFVLVDKWAEPQKQGSLS